MPFVDNKKVYNQAASQFSKTREFLWEDLKPLVKYTKDGDKVLDLACGNGRLYQLWEKGQVSYVGVDQSEELIKIAKKKFPDLEFLVGEMTDIPFGKNSFDVVFCIAAFHHLSSNVDRLKALQEMKGVLKSGGRVVMTNWNLLGRWGREKVESGKYKKWGNNEYVVPWMDGSGKVIGERYYHGFDLDELGGLFEEAGFLVEENFFSSRKKRDGQEEGENIISVLTKQHVL